MTCWWRAGSPALFRKKFIASPRRSREQELLGDSSCPYPEGGHASYLARRFPILGARGRISTPADRPLRQTGQWFALHSFPMEQAAVTFGGTSGMRKSRTIAFA